MCDQNTGSALGKGVTVAMSQFSYLVNKYQGYDHALATPHMKSLKRQKR